MIDHNDLIKLKSELDKTNFPIEICYQHDNGRRYSCNIKFQNNSLNIDCLFCSSGKMIFDNINSWECVTCNEKIKNDFF